MITITTQEALVAVNAAAMNLLDYDPATMTEAAMNAIDARLDELQAIRRELIAQAAYEAAAITHDI